MSKKVLIATITIIVIALIGIFLFMVTGNNSKEQKASKIFGNEYCEAVLHMATNDLSKHTCKICGEQFRASSMRADICSECASQTNRCEFCGRKLSEQVKAQREETLNNMNEE